MDLFSRREFLTFMGRTAAVASLPLPAFARASKAPMLQLGSFPSQKDEVVLAPGLKAEILCTFGDVINSRGERFGNDNDFTAFLPLSKDEGWLWVNHESPVHARAPGSAPLSVEEARDIVGGSLIKLVRKAGAWKVDFKNNGNYRLSGKTVIPFSPLVKIQGQEKAVGTMANCAGGVTPWGTILTCEENYPHYVGDRDSKGKKSEAGPSKYNWEAKLAFPPEHYGWVVEFDPKTRKAYKRVALGRYCREGATVTKAKDGRCVVYSGDDGDNQCLYKFISAKAGSLEAGELFVADSKAGRWLSLDWNKQPVLKTAFASPLDVLIYTREAAHLLKATRYPRPEGIAIDPQNQSVFIALTGDDAGNRGAILKIEEKGADPLSLEFKATEFIVGGDRSGFAHPDNLVFDKLGNLWMTTDLVTPMGKISHNGLFVIPLQGKHAGRALQVASAPVDAEFTGPTFCPDGKTLFLSVQHPGVLSADHLTSHWPAGGSAVPRSGVIAISGVDVFLGPLLG